ncbi:aminotransferase class I/II-fold pyridoxal phosphate-dependent enzyme, partial [candidate division FCPU426 bacterium]|nr:aminotransferase class I/II-fold pyridoxal phosphate-dependent enzyme [candidate division FCPU426 bacterium]
ECVAEVVGTYRSRRDLLVDGLNKLGWPACKPPATMFVWAPVPGQFAHMSSVDFSLKLLQEAKVAVAPGAGFGEGGEGYIRFALIENESRTRQALRGIKKMFADNT